MRRPSPARRSWSPAVAVLAWSPAAAVLVGLTLAVAGTVAAVTVHAGQATTATAQAGRDMVDRIFSGEFRGPVAPPPEWSDGGRRYLVIEPAADGRGTNVAAYDTATGQRQEILITAAQLTPSGAQAPLGIEGLSWSADRSRALVFTNTRRVWRTNSRGDYWLLDRNTSALRKLGGGAPEASLMYATFSPDGSRVAYVRDNDLYVEDAATGAITRVTTDGSDLIINGGSDWVNEEELALHNCFRWSPDGRHIAFWQFDLHGVGNFSLQYYLGQEKEIVTGIPYPQTGPYPVTMSVPYPLAGTTNSSVRVGVVAATGGAVTWLQAPGDPREHYVGAVQWVDSGTLLVQQLNRLQNTQDYLLAEASSGTVSRMWRDQDDAFIVMLDGSLPEARPLADGRGFLVQSERDGWNHVWRVTRQGQATLVTRGEMDVMAVAGVDEPGGWLYFIASPDNATQRYLYRAPLAGSSAPTRVTPASFAGTNAYDISPDGRYAFHVFSSANDPGSRQIVSLPEHATLRTVTATTDAERATVQPLLSQPLEYFKVDAGGLDVDGFVISPATLDRSRKYPVLVFVYGEPWGQTVADAWGGARSLFHRHLASLGYLVVSFDNAGTPAPRGRAWRKSIYGSVGDLSSQQQAAALRSFAKSHPYADLDRVAIWGWSGGGTNTLNALFRYPDLYKVGMSVAPVPDQRLYDTIYQERYMGLPQDNVEGYKKGSAINFAEGLRGDLLIVHGSGDDNVHYQGTQLLVNRLIELGKRFDLMTYPDRTHSISEGPGTTVHVYKLLARYLTEHLPAGPR